MKEEYIKYKKDTKRKLAFGFWNPPKYVEEIPISIKQNVAIYIFAKVFEELEFGIDELNDTNLVGVLMGGDNDVKQILSVVCKDSITLEIKSESVTKEITDWGANYKNVQLIISVFNNLIKGYKKNDFSTIEIEIKKRNNWDNYEIPEKLTSPKGFKVPSLIEFLMGILLFFTIIMFSNFLCATFFNQELFPLLLLNSFWILLSSFIFKYLIRWSYYANENTIYSVSYLTIFFSILLYLISEYLIKVKYSMNSLLDLIVVFNWEVFIEVCVYKYYLVTLFYIPLIAVPGGLLKFYDWRFPEDVINFVYYLKVKRKQPDRIIKLELSKRGWMDERLQNELIDRME